MRAPYRTLVPRTPAASSPERGRHNGRLMIRPDADDPSRACVFGALTADSVSILLDAVDRGVVVLDLSGVDQVDHHAVRALATLWPDRCTLRDCPRWLELWLARVRRHGGG